MAKAKSARSSNAKKPAAPAKHGYAYCSLPQVPPRVFAPNTEPGRARAILKLAAKWVNGTALRYYFFDQSSDGQTVFFNNGTSEWRSWATSEAEKNVVRRAFQMWKALGIGLDFKEVAVRTAAEIRIGFMRGDGAWSHIGREILNLGADKRSMNFGWDLTRRAQEIDTAVHEIGHTLGLPHEHQNPNAGIVWNEEAVYTALGGSPNFWDRAKTFHNIIRKIEPDTVQGSNWDPDSIMHYPFEAGLIDQPVQYRSGLTPASGLSERDKTWVKTFYPRLGATDYEDLKPFDSKRLSIREGEQRNFVIRPEATRNYEIRTFGTSDTVIVLFEDESGELRYRAGDDDSGEDRNAYLKFKLVAGRRYVLRVRLYYASQAGETAVMLW
jgi:hypothetical protein